MIAQELQTATKAYIAALACMAIGLVLAMVAWAPQPTRREPLLAAAFAGCMTLAWLFPVHFASKTKLYVDTAVMVAVILLFEPAVAMSIAGSGAFLAHWLRRSSRDWSQAIFNAAQAMLLAATGALFLAVAGWNPGRPSFDQPISLLLLLLAAVVMHVLSVLAVSTVIALQAGQALWESWWRALLTDPRVEILAQILLFGIGVMAAYVVDAHAWGLVLFVAPVFAVYGMLRQQSWLRLEAERARRASEASLAAAQRVAHLGSWEWDPTTDRQTWSEEAHRILGVAPPKTGMTYGTFLGVVDPSDRAAVDLAMRHALADGAPLRIDYRIVRPDGASRLVHHEAEAHRDAAGRTIRLAGVLQDVTDLKALEALVADFNERRRIDRALAQARRRLAESREDERLRLARTLHDGPVQDLLAITLQLAALAPTVECKQSATAPDSALDAVRRELLEVVGQLRGMIGELRPAGLDEFGLSAALEGYVAGLQRRSPEPLPQFHLDLDATTEDLPQALAHSLFRIAQEALRNALQHAAAHSVGVRLERSEGGVVLEVRDDGCGFEVPASLHAFAETGHFGLVGIAERVDQAGGELTLESAPGIGTTIIVRLPLDAARACDG